MQGLQHHLRKTFLAGTFAVIPIAVTVAIVIYIERLTFIKYHGLGIVLSIVAIYLTGLLVTSIIGQYFLRLFDRIMSRLPLLKDLYTAWKQISFTPGGGEGIYARVVLVPDGRGTQHVLAFSSGEPLAPDSDSVVVFVPNAPNPVTGRVAFVRRSDVIELGITAEEAFKLLLSSGNYVPPEVAERLQQRHLSPPG